jgi:hypothetical protein
LQNTAEIKEIDKRREEYEQKRGNKTAFQALQNEPKNTSGKTAHEKKQAKRERQRAERQAEQEELEKKSREWERTRGGVNANGKIPSLSPSSILKTLSHRCFPSDKTFHHLGDPTQPSSRG